VTARRESPILGLPRRSRKRKESVLHDTRFLFELLVVIAVAAAGAALFGRVRLPAIVGFLTMGALVGPGGLGLVHDPDRVQNLAELGVVFLLFEIGLELPLDRVQRVWRFAIGAGGLQVAVTTGAAAALAAALGVPLPSALVLGGLVALSSTALVMGILAERAEIDAPQGQLAIGILIFQDLCIVPFLLMLPLLGAWNAGDLRPAALAMAQSVVALGLLFGAARLVLPRVLDRATRTRSRELFGLLAFLVVLGSALAADRLGLTLAVGAFIGGLALSASPYAHQLFAEVMPVRGVLLGLFFTAVGMLVDLSAAAENLGAVAVYAGGMIGLKAGIILAIVTLVLRQGARLGVLVGLALAQTGEFSFVLAAEAARAGLLAPDLHQVFVAGSVVTLAATPFLIQAAPAVAARLLGSRLPAAADEVAGRLSDHAVILGFGVAGQSLARVLRARRVPYVVVDTNARTVQAARARGENIVFGDATRPLLLQRLGVTRARLVVVAISDPLGTREVVRALHALAPGTDVIARTRYVAEIDPLETAGAETVVAEEFEATLELLAAALRRCGVSEASIARFSAGLREEGYELLRAPAALILDPWLSELLEDEEDESR
jgi:CPA2 family monovalent cation:H+ antiporter-2